jgi:rare lipoprotein A
MKLKNVLKNYFFSCLLIIVGAVCAPALHSAEKSTGSNKARFCKATYYASKFHGRKTASGEHYNMYKLTAAHRTLPYNTMVKVTNVNNGKSVIVRINDRGPFTKNRCIDLSYEAARRIEIIRSGFAPVTLDVLKD